MKILQALSLVLILIGPSLPRKVTSVKKDASEIKIIPTELPEERIDSPRVNRQSSSLYTPAENVKYQYHFVPVPSVQHSESESENEEPSGNEPQYITQQVQEHYDIPQKTQEQILAAVIRATKQPKTPVYHATPLEPYGALLKEVPQAHKKAQEKTILVTPKPIIEHHESEDHSLGVQSGGHSYYTSAKITEALISEPKHAPVVYHHQKLHHQPSLHHHEEYEEPKSYAAKYQFGYQVRDSKHGTYFGHSESRDGHHTKGNYHVLLPDGRLQNVQYWADLSGYHAQVSYNAAAKHPVGKYH